jgi:hypothetical protein
VHVQVTVRVLGIILLKKKGYAITRHVLERNEFLNLKM